MLDLILLILPNFVNVFVIIETHKDIKIRLMSTQYIII